LKVPGKNSYGLRRFESKKYGLDQMENTLKIINRMQSEGLFASYAIGGGIAALFYIEPVTTFDLDLFIILPETTEPLVSLAPLYAWLKKNGYKPENEQVVIEGVPVQFIPAYNELVKDGVLNALDKKYGQTVTKVLRPEHLLAIMLQTFRPKDKDRLHKFLGEAVLSVESLNTILAKHGLKQNFDNFKRQYYDKQP
jgi:hypothetical protein